MSRTFYARGQTGQQLLIGAYQQMARQVGLGTVTLWNRVEMVDVVTVDGRAAGIVTRDLLTGEFRSHAGHAVVLATGGYGNVFFLSTNAMACNVTAAWRAHRKGAYFANPCYTQIHPTCIPQSDDFQSKLTLMSESLRNDGRVWVPQNPDETRPPSQVPEDERDYYLERHLPELRQPGATRHRARAPPSGPSTRAVAWALARTASTSTSPTPSAASARTSSRSATANLFEMYERITGESPTRCRCGSTPRRTTRWADCGSTTS